MSTIVSTMVVRRKFLNQKKMYLLFSHTPSLLQFLYLYTGSYRTHYSSTVYYRYPVGSCRSLEYLDKGEAF